MYRLGVFGFMAHPLLSEKYKGLPKGNQGLEDQLAALQWVKRNIRAFGGNPEQITIAGQSAGGMSVQCLLTSPKAKECIQGAILMSSGGIAPKGMGIVMDRSLEKAYKDGEALFSVLGISNMKEAESLPASQIFQAGLEVQAKEGSFVWTPTIDHEFLYTDSRTALLNGYTADVPCMIGACKTESIPLIDSSSVYPSLESFQMFLQSRLGSKAVEFFKELNLHTDEELYELVKTDEAFASSTATRAFAHRQLQDGKTTYVYLFDHDIPGDDSGSFHGSDLWFVFESLNRCWRPFVGKHYDLARKVSGYWANFVRCGNPNGNDKFGFALPCWKPYEPQKPFVMTFRDEPEPDSRYESNTMKHMLSICLEKKEDK